MDGITPTPSEIKAYVDHCVQEKVSTFLTAPLGQKDLNVANESVSDKVDIHNIVKGLGGADGGMGGFGGGGMLGGLLIGALLGNRNGGLFGGGNDGQGGETRLNDTIANTAILTKLGSIEAAIPLASAQTENVILQQTNALTNLSTQTQLAMCQGFAGVKDAVQNGVLLNLNATQNASKEILQAVCSLGGKIDAQTIAQLQAELAEERGGRRADSVRVDVTQQVNQQQAQAQVAQTLTGLATLVAGIQNQLNHQNDSIVNLGTMVGSANPISTQVRT
jgi:hypothetical protein